MTPDFLIPIWTYPDLTSRAGLGRALDVAAKVAARLTVVIHEADIPAVQNSLAEAMLNVSELIAAAEATSRKRGADIAAWCEDRAGSLNLRIEVQKARCRPEAFLDHLVRSSRTHGFTVLVLDAQGPALLDAAESLIFGSGGPVIVIPAVEPPIPLAGGETPANVFLAWDGSRAAARALRDALPILTRARTVSIVTVDDDKPIDAASLAGARQLLAHHGIEARHIARDRRGAPIGEMLQSIAVAGDADLLVMGAYGHSRLQEFVLGGATRSVLAKARLPILLSH